MITSTILGLLIPFIGTSLGAACVLFMKNELSVKNTKMLSGFAAGVMIAASVWSISAYQGVWLCRDGVRRAYAAGNVFSYTDRSYVGIFWSVIP